MPHRRYRGRDGREGGLLRAGELRGESGRFGKARAEARILHPDLNRNRTLFRAAQTQQARQAIAKAETDQVEKELSLIHI